jgi:hypothetical protein
MTFQSFAKLGIVALIFGALPSSAQDLSSAFLVVKGRAYSQTADAAPAALTVGGASIGMSVQGEGGPPLAIGGQVLLPGGVKLTLPFDGDLDLFITNVVADTPAALSSMYPAGNYALTLMTTVLGDLVGTVALPPDAFPVPPQVSGYAGLQTVDAGLDFALTFQPLVGAKANDMLYLKIMDGGSVVL